MLYDVYDDKDTFLFRSELPVMGKIFRWQKAAEHRVLLDTATKGGLAKMHFNGRSNPFNTQFVLVEKAYGPRANN